MRYDVLRRLPRSSVIQPSSLRQPLVGQRGQIGDRQLRRALEVFDQAPVLVRHRLRCDPLNLAARDEDADLRYVQVLGDDAQAGGDVEGLTSGLGTSGCYRTPSANRATENPAVATRGCASYEA
jgi:hypothetical protein